ncbi:MAG: NUDIX hydrolase domain-like protein [Benjaminiella poitrasii]|nr:MAG: NUDIX hydrolase domain-like protein [Benjaminiella poitrasii]
MSRSITPPPTEAPINDEYTTFSKKSRHGHGQDVVDANNIRQVAGCLPLDLNNRRVLLISSRKNINAWVLPKGGWERDETQKHAAQRETWEEAGIKGTITRSLGIFEERTQKKRHLKAHHWIFEMNIEEIAKKFPEKKKRERRWFTFEESLIATQDHPYIQQAILKSSLNPSNRPPSPRASFDDDDDIDSKPIQDAIVPQNIRRKSIMKSIKSMFN